MRYLLRITRWFMRAFGKSLLAVLAALVDLLAVGLGATAILGLGLLAWVVLVGLTLLAGFMGALFTLGYVLWPFGQTWRWGADAGVLGPEPAKPAERAPAGIATPRMGTPLEAPEFVLTAEQIREAVRNGRLPGFSAGGRVN